MLLRGRNQGIVDATRRSKLRICRISRKSEEEYHNQNNNSVHIIRDERGLDSAEEGIQDDADRKQEASGGRVDAGQGGQNSSATRQQHGCDEDVGHEAEDDEDDVDGCSVARANDLEEGVGVWSASLKFDCKSCKKEDLDACACFSLATVLVSGGHQSVRTRCIEEGTRDAVFICHRSRLEQCRCPSPATDNCSSYKTRLHGTASR